MASTPVVEVSDLCKSYGGRAVVDGVSLAVEEGEIFGILGPNGAGKTTTVECVEGLRVPDAGRVRVTGLDPVADHQATRQVLGAQLQESENDGLPQALKGTVAEWAERTAVRAEFTVTGTVEQLHEEVSATLLRIAQEALSNASRHARATRVGVTLSFLGDEVILDIRDDGQGFDPFTVPERSHTGGFGLDGMRARAERIAGSFTVESEPGHGTAVSARVPLVRHE